MRSCSLERARNRPRFIPYHLRPVQKYLDRFWPTLTLRLNPRTANWIITDLAYHSNGLPNRYEMHGLRDSLRSAIGGHGTREVSVVQFVQRVLIIHGDEQADFWAYSPCRDRLADMLHYAFHGNHTQLLEHLEQKRRDREDLEESQSLDEMRDAARATAEIAWNRHKGRTIASRDGVSTQRKVGRDIAKKLREEQEAANDPAEIAAAVRETGARGEICGGDFT